MTKNLEEMIQFDEIEMRINQNLDKKIKKLKIYMPA